MDDPQESPKFLHLLISASANPPIHESPNLHPSIKKKPPTNSNPPHAPQVVPSMHQSSDPFSP
ncbi:hypothetical protein CC78DRAFT_535349 [Lojkania enalia]|uniref:Uncharacterized protein n=1 Tax=Lojkania enalia TaxID=147567 RepID=A0A9P4N0V4_9PLEO|nr:hypothetical protein CC78DRAFT_535349 [Didymosphaeria enalia]